MRCLKSSEPIVTLYWIPSHTEKQIGQRRTKPTHPPETTSRTNSRRENNYLLFKKKEEIIFKKRRETSALLNLKKCKQPSVQMKSKLGIIPWHHSKDRAFSPPTKIRPHPSKLVRPPNQRRSGSQLPLRLPRNRDPKPRPDRMRLPQRPPPTNSSSKKNSLSTLPPCWASIPTSAQDYSSK